MRLLSFFYGAMIAVMAFTSVVRGDVTLPNVIGDHMVLQQKIAVPIWGEAAPGEKVTVTLGVAGWCECDTVSWLP